MSEIEDEAFKLIQSNPKGILQSELWKLLNIDSRKCSRIVKKLTDADQIERIDHKSDGVKTYLLKAKKRAIEPELLLAGGDLLPCIGCEEECSVQDCPLLMDWMYQLAIEEFSEDTS
ncbi:winged helix-turn-helix transcriptional regulator [Methanomicrobium antiquum]|uniref:Winged helix-turn-helix transcriptional regulator n=1 Tax=Methanomicrobium antiquum TaxID=487686 RepID=A0AAF0FT31_9EURY|nr:winged helix-turn-helix transcriptional regulator [Methanomicrobium antiquum]MDD3977367.1 winged helix-turn-helix transcriptional regulator [Methanomicrobium sp.]WFN37431.1 winged helix-turn-helix transcriptional regulator [Methanomicrobium antiquum]